MASKFKLCNALLLVQFLFIILGSCECAMKIFGYNLQQMDEFLAKYPKCKNISDSIGQTLFTEQLAHVQYKVIDRMNSTDKDDPKTCCVQRVYLDILKAYLDKPDCAEMKVEIAKQLADMEEKLRVSLICAPERLKCENGMPQLSEAEQLRWDCAEKRDDIKKMCTNQMHEQMKELPLKVFVQFKGNVFTSPDACCLYWNFMTCLHKVENEPSCELTKTDYVTAFQQQAQRDRVNICNPDKLQCKSAQPKQESSEFKLFSIIYQLFSSMLND